ncbi:disease resistance protein Roq1 isoform X2 [Cryptomeria japonica]|uniref:disease resistance protein Roq1 isoform X2 n=1 Tax=Cryptomeria japonica TaxID=3369 RepID=UPI0027DA6863|nr:disease resistance protein Roq1 isoform X2 [Cryptomeria japonica]
MASSSSSHQQNQEFNAFSVMEPGGKRRKVCESTKLFDVFINHRGPDVKGTLATQLYNSLQQLRIAAFLDSQEKELGNSFPSIIETAIRSAKVHIAIFSRRYAESSWCLDELVLMLESTAKIIPVFYEVEPWELRHIEKGVYAEAFLKYEEKGRYLEKLNTWKEALQSLSFTAGEEFSSDWDCQKIVAAVKKEVQRKTCLHVAEYSVGLDILVEDFEKRCLDERVQDFENQCGQEEGKHKAQVVGIFGMGGVGKTTLAKELFNRKKLNYTRASFLFDVREKSVRSELSSLQSTLIKDLFDKEISFTNTEQGTTCLKDCLRRSPLLSVLIVVDDIDHVDQLNALAVMDILKSSDNSLVIVTTRDAGVLITTGITLGYNLKGMDRDYARELFCWHAFDQPNPCSGYDLLVNSFVDKCGGLPLSLRVLGRHVRNKPHSYWGSELNKVSKSLPRDVKKKLLISFEALDDEEKQVFMDAACFFVGKPKSIAERIWEGSGWDAQHALEALKDKCLVEEIETLSLNIQGEIELRMHDHLRDLGREMALELSPPHRLWRPQDLKSLKLMGFKNILAKTNIRCFSSFFDASMGSQVTFFLGQSNSCLEASASLLWLQLEGNSKEQPSIPSWIPLQNLHYLKILKQFKTLRENRMQAPSQLKELQISQISLKEFPDFIGISDNLENVLVDAGGFLIQDLSLLESLRMNLCSLCLRFSKLKGQQGYTKRGERILCESLVIDNFKFNGEVDWSNGQAPMSGLENLEISNEESVSNILICGIHYPSLKFIKLHYMKNLVEMDLTRVRTLNSLDITNCPKLKRLAATSDPYLRNSISVAEIQDLRNVAGSKVKNCTDHFNIVSREFGLRMLAQLYISECQELEELRLGHLSCLKKITIENCIHLKSLCFSGMKCLESITFQTNVMVKYFELDDCQNLKTMQFGCEELVELSIRGCPELKKLPEFKGLNCLERIVIDGCGKVKYLQLYHCRVLKSVSGNSIRWLHITTSCTELEELPDLSGMSYLEEIEISECEKIQNIRLPSTLIRLCVNYCGDLQTVAGTGDILELIELTISDCPALEELPCLYRVNEMEKIKISDCEKIQNIRLPSRLICLCVKNCKDLQTVAGTGDILELRELTIRGCPALQELPCLYRVNEMEKIKISDCEKIQNIRLPSRLFRLCVDDCGDLQTVAGLDDILELRELTIRGCPVLEELPCLYRLNAIEEIEVRRCERIQSIRLPSTLVSLFIESCRDLQRVEGISDLLGLRELTIRECPELKELPSLCRFSLMEEIVIDSCEKLQNMAGIEELQVQKYLRIACCSNALIRNSIHKLKCFVFYCRVNHHRECL